MVRLNASNRLQRSGKVVTLSVTHNFTGGDAPKKETEKLTGKVGESYTIKTRATEDYPISSESSALLKGKFDTDKEITIEYKSTKE